MSHVVNKPYWQEDSKHSFRAMTRNEKAVSGDCQTRANRHKCFSPSKLPSKGKQKHMLPRQTRLWQVCMQGLGWAEPESALADWLWAAEGPEWPLPLGPACPLPGGCSMENELEAVADALPCIRHEHCNEAWLR